MQEATFSWHTADGLYIHARIWEAEQPKAVICLAHGLGEHIGRYEHFARWFTNRGYSLIGYDRRGHGRSAGKKGHSPGVSALVDEVAHLIIEAEARYQGLPVFLYGHSQGGAIALSYFLRRHPQLAGVVASAPWLRLSFEPPAALITLGKMVRHIYPGFQQSNKLDTAMLSRDPEVVEDYESDPLVHNRITAGIAISMMEEGEWLLQQKTPVPCPLLVLHGTRDKITSAKASEAFVGQLSGDAAFEALDGLYHEIHNEPEWEAVLSRVAQWMNSRI